MTNTTWSWPGGSSQAIPKSMILSSPEIFLWSDQIYIGWQYKNRTWDKEEVGWLDIGVNYLCLVNLIIQLLCDHYDHLDNRDHHHHSHHRHRQTWRVSYLLESSSHCELPPFIELAKDMTFKARWCMICVFLKQILIIPMVEKHRSNLSPLEQLWAFVPNSTSTWKADHMMIFWKLWLCW